MTDLPCAFDADGFACDCTDALCPMAPSLRAQKDDALLAAHRVVVEAQRGIEPTHRYVVFAVVNAHGDQDDVRLQLGRLMDATGIDYEEIAVLPAGAGLRAVTTDFVLPSRSRGRRRYPMVRTPEGYAVHQGEGCEGEIFNGVLGCWHAKENSMTSTAIVKAEAVLSPAPIAFNDDQIATIKESICKGATDAELQLFLITCTRAGLDPFMGQIYAVKRYDSKERREVMAIQIGIDGRRLVAERTGKYGGQDPIEWLDINGVWSQVWTGDGDYPVAARCSVYRLDWPNHKATAVCRWSSYAQYFGAEKKLSPTWEKMPDVMLGKCAENLALRRAFPAEMSNIDALSGGYDASRDVETYVEPAGVIEGTVVTHEDGQEPHAAEAADREAASAPAPSPDKAPTAIAEYRAYWRSCVTGAGLSWDDIEALSQRDYGNRVPGQLGPKELVALAEQVGVTVPLPGQAALPV